MEQIRPFPPTDLIDKAEEQEAILLAPAVDLKNWVVANWLTLGGELHNPDHDHIRGFQQHPQVMESISMKYFKKRLMMQF